MSEYLPTKPIWLVFDLSNGHAPVKHYTWWFDTRKSALSHIHHHKQLINAAPLSRPIRFYPSL